MIGNGTPRNSDTILRGPERAPARSMLKAVGYDDDALSRPIVGIANTWIETMPCNLGLRRLAEHAKAGVRAARPWSSTPSPSATGSPWAPKG